MRTCIWLEARRISWMVLRDVDHRWVGTVYAFLLFFVAITLSRIGELCVFRDNNNFLRKYSLGSWTEIVWNRVFINFVFLLFLWQWFALLKVEWSKNVWNRIVHSLCFFLFQWRSNNFFLTFQNWWFNWWFTRNV